MYVALESWNESLEISVILFECKLIVTDSAEGKLKEPEEIDGIPLAENK